METAKSLQLLDERNDNISPMVNIESLYYEERDTNGVIYRKSMYTHFPVQVKYNNNVDKPYRVYTGNPTTYSDQEKIIYGTEAENPTRWKLKATLDETSLLTYKNEDGLGEHLMVSSIVQRAIGNTPYKLLDVTTLDLSDILYMYAPKQWSSNNFEKLQKEIEDIQYDSADVEKYGFVDYDDPTRYNPDEEIGFGNDPRYLYSTATVGNIEKGTDSKEFNHMKYIDLMDKIFFKQNKVECVDVSIFTTNGTELLSYSLTQNDIENGKIVDCADGTLKQNACGCKGYLRCDTIDDASTYGYWWTSYTNGAISGLPIDNGVISIDDDNYINFENDLKINGNSIQMVNGQIYKRNGMIFYDCWQNYFYRTKTYVEYKGNYVVKDNFNQEYSAKEVEDMFVDTDVYASNYFEGQRVYQIKTHSTGTTNEGRVQVTLDTYVSLNIPVFTSDTFDNTLDGVYSGTRNDVSTYEYDSEVNQYYHIFDMVQDQSKDMYITIPKFLSEEMPTLYKINQYGVWQDCNDWELVSVNTSLEQYNVFKFTGDGFSGEREIKIKLIIK